MSEGNWWVRGHTTTLHAAWDQGGRPTRVTRCGQMAPLKEAGEHNGWVEATREEPFGLICKGCRKAVDRLRAAEASEGEVRS